MNRIATSLTFAFTLAAGAVPALAGSAIGLSPLPGAPHHIAAAARACGSRDADATISRPYMPVLPTIAAEQGTSGTTLVEIRLGATGSLESSNVFATSGNPHIDRAALEAARLSSYAPAMHGCTASGGSYLLHVEFTK